MYLTDNRLIFFKWTSLNLSLSLSFGALHANATWSPPIPVCLRPSLQKSILNGDHGIDPDTLVCIRCSATEPSHRLHITVTVA
ncbi:hypothetical protein PR003_g12618 [Phytophthora rubi]|uniref:Secreted protein n=1 Tax=Phytophthora rubi TaxID=129364 RepID=A0A6A3ML66_9STRA|nr:hypothetical protein PR002_g10295 [Phytophthora rubi]KAE9336218.1 hypothetical protein PR003_g12618 [Phytophthora rubi]